MPLVRVEVRNEYALGGAAELCGGGGGGGAAGVVDKEDPKAVLEGVAVAGLVGILRQLGDLAEFAAEVFHGLQEQVMHTSSRSHKLMARVQKVEAALPSLEKIVLAQRSHLHFAYTAGSNWHARIRCQQNHFIYNDLPRFIMESYGECNGPPRLDLLDKFDPGGPGSCLKRYSDPTFFRRASPGFNEAYAEKSLKDKKGRRIKKKRSWQKKREVSHGASFSNTSGRIQFVPLYGNAQTSPVPTVPTCETAFKSDLGDRPNSMHLRNESDYLECLSHPNTSVEPEEQELKDLASSPVEKDLSDSFDYTFLGEECAFINEETGNGLAQEQNATASSCVTWDATTETVEPVADEYMHHEILGDPYVQGIKGVSFNTDEQYENSEGHITYFDHDTKRKEFAHSEIVGQSEHDDLETHLTVLEQDIQEGKPIDSGFIYQEGKSVDSGFTYQNEHDEYIGHNTETPIHAQEIQDNNVLIADKMEEQLDTETVPSMICGEIQCDEVESETDNFIDALNTIESESETDLDCQTRQELEHRCSLNDNSMDAAAFDSRMQNSDCDSSNADMGIASSSCSNAAFDPSSLLTEPCSAVCSSLERVTSEDVTYSSFFDNSGHPQPCQEFSSSVTAVNHPDPDSCIILDDTNGSRLECIPTRVSSCSKEHSPEVSVNERITNGSHRPCETTDKSGGPNVDSILNMSSTVSSQEHNVEVRVNDEITGSIPEARKPPPQPSNVTAVNFWTNGGLLGLQPSKPPDFVVSGNIIHDDSTGQSDKLAESLKHLDQGPSQTSFSWQNDQVNGFSHKNTSYSVSDVRHENKNNLQFQNSIDNSVGHVDGNNRIGTKATGTIQLFSQERQAASFDSNGRHSSRMFELGSKILGNGFYRTLSLDGNDRSKSTNIMSAGVLDQNTQNDLAYGSFPGRTKDMFCNKSPLTSPSSSPPLQHMKISFQPADDFETSQLKLKFLDGNSGYESNKDMFPSFQLVPEPAVSFHDFGSDSDDDTFCRSSPYRSDDGISHQSESNSEQWESGESPDREGQELYDSFRRMSLAESVSTSVDTGGTGIHDNHGFGIQFSENDMNFSQSGRMLDLPSLDALNHSFKQERNETSAAKEILGPQFLQEPRPPAPPLPPVQWSCLKPHSEEDRQDVSSEVPNYALDKKLSGFTMSQQPKPAPLKQEQVMGAVNTLKRMLPNTEKTNGQEEAHQAAYRKVTGEKEDFLHQIRTKSFSLRRTSLEKPAMTTGPPASVKVTAILEKANAIRQVVGSDDGEDDNWSDV